MALYFCFFLSPSEVSSADFASSTATELIEILVGHELADCQRALEGKKSSLVPFPT